MWFMKAIKSISEQECIDGGLNVHNLDHGLIAPILWKQYDGAIINDSD